MLPKGPPMCPVSSLDLEGQNQVAQHTPTEEAHGSLKSRDILYLQAPRPLKSLLAPPSSDNGSFVLQ